MGREPLSIQISTASILRVILFGVLVWLLVFLWDLVLTVVTAVVIASAIEPLAAWFVRMKVPRPFAVLLVYLLVVLSFAAVIYLFVPPLLDDLSSFLSTLPQYLNELSVPTVPGSSELIERASLESVPLQEFVSGVRSAFSSFSVGFFRTVSVVFGGILSFVLIFVFSFYFAVQETGIDDFLRVITPVKHQARVLNLWKRSQQKIGLWMQGQLLLALVVGVLVYLLLTVFGVQYALLLGILAAILELIPVFGPILAAVPAVVIALTTGTSFFGPGFGSALTITLIYALIQQFENHLLYPLVVSKVVGVPPMLVILALIIGASLAGFLGIILAVPVAAVLQELVRDLERERRGSSQ